MLLFRYFDSHALETLRDRELKTATVIRLKFMKNCFVILIGLLLVDVNCGTNCLANPSERVTFQQKILPRENPTNYEFTATIKNVQDAIKKSFDKWREVQTKKYQGRTWKGFGDAETKQALSQALQSSGLLHLGLKDAAILVSPSLANKLENEDDAYIFGGTSPVGESQIYFKDGQPLIYFAGFHIHLTTIDPQRTRVDIFTYGSRVITGLDKSWSPHGSSFIFVEVPPTTIEQYQILLGIGQQLGVTNMPSLVEPEPDTPVKVLTLPRER